MRELATSLSATRQALKIVVQKQGGCSLQYPRNQPFPSPSQSYYMEGQGTGTLIPQGKMEMKAAGKENNGLISLRLDIPVRVSKDVVAALYDSLDNLDECIKGYHI